MTDLTDFEALWGRNKRQENPQFKHRETAWPHVEERIRPILDMWESMAGFHPTDEQTKRQWRYGARQWCDAHGENTTELLRETSEYMQRHGLTMTSPGSCINTARRFKPENRKAYFCPSCHLYPCECDAHFEPEPDRDYPDSRPRWAKRKDLE